MVQGRKLHGSERWDAWAWAIKPTDTTELDYGGLDGYFCLGLCVY